MPGHFLAQYTKNEMEALNPVGNWLKDSNFVFHPPSSHVRIGNENWKSNRHNQLLYYLGGP